VSLRKDIHSAYGSITPSVAGMPERVVQSVSREAQRPRASMLSHLRAPLSMVAVLTLISLVAEALVGGRLIQSFNNVHPAVGPHQRTLAQLGAIPLNLAALRAGDACPDHPGSNSLGYDYGSGPVYINGKLLPEINTDSGALYPVTFYSNPDLTGLVLVRGRDLNDGMPIMFIGPQGAGFPSDTPPWPLKNELVINAGHPPARSAATHYGIWHVLEFIPAGWSGCWGYQVDGSNFSETISGFVRPF
jgi:hypothetical protein